MPSQLREMRRSIDFSQAEFARLLGIPLETLRTWDSGRRLPAAHVHVLAREAIERHVRNTELLSLATLASEFGMHERTLQDAARVGRLDVHLLTRSAFGRAIRRATRAAVGEYKENYYRRSYSRTMSKPPRPTPVDLPEDYAERVTLARHRLRLTLAEFAHRVGAANKAVVYQWESGKRKPSAVFWNRIAALPSAPRRKSELRRG